MKIAVLSDIHGNLAALEAVLEDAAAQGAGTIVNCGDILSGPLWVAETAGFLMARNFTTIAGNHERQLLSVRSRGGFDLSSSDGFAASKLQESHAAWLKTLPATHWLTPEVLMVHGTPSSDITYWLETTMPGFGTDGSPGIRAAHAAEVEERLGSAKAPLILCGHSHVPRAVLCRGTLIVNPGSVGLQAYSDDHGHRHVTENGSPHARYAIVEKRDGGWQVDQRAVPYDWAAAARLARDNGREDWAHALLHGTMPLSTFSPRSAS